MTTRMAVKTIAAALDATALRIPDRIALVSASPESVLRSITADDDSPSQTEDALSRYTYSQFMDTTNRLSGFLKAYGFESKDVLMSDLPNVAENLMLQIACNRIGVTYATSKGLEGMAKLPQVRGAVSASGTGFLAETTLSLPYLSGDFLFDLIHGSNCGGSAASGLLGLDEFGLEFNEQDDAENVVLPPHAYYNNATPYTNEEALEQGADAAWKVAMIEEDVVCIAITLCHAFGMGSAVCSTLQQGATLVLPAVGGIRGCGVPSQRAEATLRALESEDCTLLFADTHTMKAFSDVEVRPEELSLKGGVCKVGSGSEFLEETINFAGATFHTLGSKPKE